jgi:TRAP transporter TAXI family solute receptor
MKSTKKRLLTSALVGCLSFLFTTTAFCGEWRPPKEWKFITFAGGVAAGSFTPISAKLCELVNKQIPGINAKSTLGHSYSNLKALDKNKIQIAYATAPVFTICYYGQRKMKGHATKNIRFFGSTHYGPFYMIVPKDSDIKDLSVLAKRPLRLAVGNPASANNTFNKAVFKAYGTSFKDMTARGGTIHKIESGPAGGMLRDGHLDLLMFTTAIRGAQVMELATTLGIRFLELGPREKQSILKDIMGISDVTIPKDMFPGIKEDFHTVASFYSIFINKDMPEELAYRLCKAFWGNLREIQSVGAFGEYIKLENALSGMTIPLHPGCARYYKERGMTIPEPQKPEIP